MKAEAIAAAPFDSIAADFALLDDWEDRYRYIIDLGRDMPPLPEAQKNAGTRVEGCASQVWLAASLQSCGSVKRLTFSGDSDALIVRGLIALLRTLLSGRTAQDILACDVAAEFARLDLEDHLTAQRSNGLRAMIARVRDLARNAS